MELSINDLVYNGQFDDHDLAKKVLLSHVKNIEASAFLCANKGIRRTENLKNKKITSRLSILEFCQQVLGKSNIPQDRSLNTLLLRVFVKSPYIKPNGAEIFTFNDHNIAGTALSYCIENTLTRGVVSPDIDGAKGDIQIKNSKGEVHAVITNYYSQDQISGSFWEYQENPKHDIPRDIIVKGNVWSKMPLSKKDAQKLLSCSIKIKDKRSAFGFTGGQWYQFYNHESNYYHGFPITNPGNDKDLNKVDRFLKMNDVSNCGQIII